MVDLCAHHGNHEDEDLDLLGELMACYEAYARYTTPAERLETLRAVCGLIESGSTRSSALQPFLYMEDDLAVLGAAAEALVWLYEGDGEDVGASAGARFVRRLVDEAEDDVQRAGLILGLLRTGDLRVEPLVTGVWRLLGFGGQQRLVRSLTREPNPLVIRFLTEWGRSAEGIELDLVREALSGMRRGG